MAQHTLSGVIAAVATAVDETGAPDAARSVKLARFLLRKNHDLPGLLGEPLEHLRPSLLPASSSVSRS